MRDLSQGLAFFIGISFLRYKKDCVVLLTLAKKQRIFFSCKQKNMFYNLFLGNFHLLLSVFVKNKTKSYQIRRKTVL